MDQKNYLLSKIADDSLTKTRITGMVENSYSVTGAYSRVHY